MREMSRKGAKCDPWIKVHIYLLALNENRESRNPKLMEEDRSQKKVKNKNNMSEHLAFDETKEMSIAKKRREARNKTPNSKCCSERHWKCVQGKK